MFVSFGCDRFACLPLASSETSTYDHSFSLAALGLFAKTYACAYLCFCMCVCVCVGRVRELLPTAVHSVSLLVRKKKGGAYPNTFSHTEIAVVFFFFTHRTKSFQLHLPIWLPNNHGLVHFSLRRAKKKCPIFRAVATLAEALSQMAGLITKPKHASSSNPL